MRKDGPAEPAPPPPPGEEREPLPHRQRRSRFANFVGIWVLSLAAFVVVIFLLKALIGI